MIQQTTKLAALFPSCSIVEHETEADWLADRKGGIGASESASVFGCGYAGTSPLTVWASKVKGYRPEFSADQLRRMNLGKKMEPIIAEMFAEETGLEVIDPGDYAIFRHLKHEWLFASLDRIVIDDDGPQPLELKYLDGRQLHEWEEDATPLKFNVQCQHQTEVVGSHRTYIAALIGGHEFRHRKLERDDRFIQAMVPTLGEFWAHVVSGEMPDVDGAEGTKAALAYLFPRPTLDTVDLPETSAEWDRELIAVKDELKTLEAKRARIENQIKAAIGDHERGDLPGGSAYTWRAQTRNSIDTKRLRDEFPEAAEACETVTEFRVLRRTDK